jgi:hypothetical protein
MTSHVGNPTLERRPRCWSRRAPAKCLERSASIRLAPAGQPFGRRRAEQGRRISAHPATRDQRAEPPDHRIGARSGSEQPYPPATAVGKRRASVLPRPAAHLRGTASPRLRLAALVARLGADSRAKRSRGLVIVELREACSGAWKAASAELTRYCTGDVAGECRGLQTRV